MSAAAAVLWPKKNRTDRKRFVELWARYADSSLLPNHVSVPLLIESLREKGRDDVAEVLRLLRQNHLERIPEFDDMIVSGSQVDMPVDVVTTQAGLSLVDVREFTYGNIFYRYFRSAYVHEYKVGTHGDGARMTELRNAVLYEGGWSEPPYRRISLHINWIIAIVKTICSNLANDWPRRPLALPDPWWVDGG
jgi:hypothetical protein